MKGSSKDLITLHHEGSVIAMAFSPDGRTMYLSDSHPSVQAVWAFDYDTDTGTPHNRRLFVDMNPLPGRPDGQYVTAQFASQFDKGIVDEMVTTMLDTDGRWRVTGYTYTRR